MKKGIDAVISTIILLIIAVAIVGLAYAFISGYFGAVTGSAVIISGASTCDSTGATNIVIRNAGSQKIAITSSPITIVRTQCSPGPSGGCGTPTFQYFQAGTTTVATDIPISSSVVAIEQTNQCGSGNSCVYELNVGGTIYTTRANCA